MSVRARLYLVRHGETDANKNGIIQGQTDTQLNNVGIGQAVLVAEALRSIPFDKAYTSDLARASATADAILKHHPDVQLKKQDALRERVSLHSISRGRTIINQHRSTWGIWKERLSNRTS